MMHKEALYKKALICYCKNPNVSSLARVASRTISYTYDPLSRLTDVFYSTGEQFEYAYTGTLLCCFASSRVPYYNLERLHKSPMTMGSRGHGEGG
jgi:hypothetical protein